MKPVQFGTITSGSAPITQRADGAEVDCTLDRSPGHSCDNIRRPRAQREVGVVTSSFFKRKLVHNISAVVVRE